MYYYTIVVDQVLVSIAKFTQDKWWDILRRRERTVLILQGESISFPTLIMAILFNSGFRCLSKFAFKCSVIQQRETVVLESMSFEAPSCKGGASISMYTSRALILRIPVWHLFESKTVIMLPCILTYDGTRLPIDSHIQHFILATEEATVTQQVSYRPTKCQSRSWSSRVTTANGSHKW